MKSFITFCFLLLFFSCVQPGAGPPPVDTKALAPLVADLQLAEALAGEVPVIARDSMREVFFEKTLAEHETTRAEFDSLLWIIRREPAWVDSLYVRVGEILTRRQAERKN